MLGCPLTWSFFTNSFSFVTSMTASLTSDPWSSAAAASNAAATRWPSDVSGVSDRHTEGRWMLGAFSLRVFHTSVTYPALKVKPSCVFVRVSVWLTEVHQQLLVFFQSPFEVPLFKLQNAFFLWYHCVSLQVKLCVQCNGHTQTEHRSEQQQPQLLHDRLASLTSWTPDVFQKKVRQWTYKRWVCLSLCVGVCVWMLLLSANRLNNQLLINFSPRGLL